MLKNLIFSVSAVGLLASTQVFAVNTSVPLENATQCQCRAQDSAPYFLSCAKIGSKISIKYGVAKFDATGATGGHFDGLLSQGSTVNVSVPESYSIVIANPNDFDPDHPYTGPGELDDGSSKLEVIWINDTSENFKYIDMVGNADVTDQCKLLNPPKS